MKNAIEVQGLKKSFGKIQAVKGIDFTVKEGQLFAFLGPNGAGKSTTIDMLCTLLAPDGGNALVDGHPLGRADEAIRRSIGVVFQDSLLDQLLTVEENLQVRGRFYGLQGQALKDAIGRAAKAADVLEFLHRRYGKLSGGQRRRADIARALVHTPRILFMDEPTTGLDPKTKEGVWQTVRKLQKEAGMTVFLTTHYMEEAATADYITILRQGEIAVAGTPYDLQAQYSRDRLVLKAKDKKALVAQLESRKVAYGEKNGLVLVDLMRTLDALPLLGQLEPLLESFEVSHGSMETVFLTIVGDDETEKEAQL